MSKQMLKEKEPKEPKKPRMVYNGYKLHSFTAVADQPIVAGSIVREEEQPSENGNKNKPLTKLLFERDGKGEAVLGGQMAAAVMYKTLTEQRWKDFKGNIDFERLESKYQGVLAGERIKKFYFNPITLKLHDPITEQKFVDMNQKGESVIYIAEVLPTGTELNIGFEAPYEYPNTILKDVLGFGISKYGFGKASRRKTGLYGRCHLT